MSLTIAKSVCGRVAAPMGAQLPYPAPVGGSAPRTRAVIRTQHGRLCRAGAAPLTLRAVPKGRDGVIVPLDYYKILGVTRMSSPDAVIRGYQAAIDNPIDAGYSKQVLALRNDILYEASQILSNREFKATYDAAHQAGRGDISGEVEVPLQQLPGALVLLHEVGELDVVIELGETFLRENAIPSLVPDVATTVALAHCDFAARIMASSSSSIEDAYEELEVAAITLSKYRSPDAQLRRDVADAMAGMASDYVRGVLSRPPGEDGDDARGRAVATLKKLLWGQPLVPGVSPTQVDRDGLMAPLAGRLSASEVVQVFESAPKGATGPDEAYELATALMGKALVEARPALLPRARDILLSIASSDVGSGRADTVLVELSVCELLLGNPSSSLAFLGLAEGPSVRIRQILMRASVDRSVRDFVLENSIGSDYLPGACILAERWVNQTLIPAYPELEGADFVLADWFEDDAVANELEDLQRSKVLGISAILGAAKGAIGRTQGVVAAIGGALQSAISSVLGTVQRPGSLPAGAALRSRALGGKDLEDGGSAGEFSTLKSVERQLKAYMRSQQGTSALWRWGAVAVIAGSAYGYGVRQRVLPAPEAVVRMVDSVDVPSLGNVRIMMREAVQGKAVQTTAESSPQARAMNDAVAEGVVRQWQGVKAAALGKGHEVHRLGEVLDGRMLQQWRARAIDMKQQAVHWDYRIGRVVIDSVEVSSDGERAIVEATLDESAEQVEGGLSIDSYTSTYSAQYQMARRGGVWKIVGAKVIYR